MLLDFASKLGGDVEKIKQSANIHPTNNYYGDCFIEYGTLCNIYNDVAIQSKLSSFVIDTAMSFPSSMPQLGAYTALRSFSKTVKDWSAKRTRKRASIFIQKSCGNIYQISDYSSPKSFSLACKRWVGKSPSEFRDL